MTIEISPVREALLRDIVKAYHSEPTPHGKLSAMVGLATVALSTLLIGGLSEKHFRDAVGLLVETVIAQHRKKMENPC